MTEEVRVVLVTGPDRDALLRIARAVVEDRLAACVNVWEGVRSVYRWEGSVHEEEEGMAVLKAPAGRIQALEERVRALHPYDEPEFVVLPVEGGAESYLEWIIESTTETDR